MSAEIVSLPARAAPRQVPKKPRPLVVRVADALHILQMARDQLKSARVDHRRGDVRQIDCLLWVVGDTLERGIAEHVAEHGGPTLPPVDAS